MADPEDQPLELPLAAGDDEAPQLELAVVGLPVEILGNPCRRDRLRGMGGVGKEREPESQEARASRRGARRVAGEDGGGRLLLHQAQAFVDLVQDGNGRRPGRLAAGRTLTGAPQIEVEARHPRRLHGRPGALGDGREGHAGGAHPRLLRTGDDEVQAPGIHREGDGTEGADRVDEDERLGGDVTDHGGQLGDRVGDPGGGLVVGQEHSLDRRLFQQRGADRGRGRGPPPLDLEAADIGAVDLGHLREAIPEGPPGHGDDPIAGREDVDHGSLQGTRARGGEGDDLGLCAEERPHAVNDPLQERGELGTAVVDHLASPGGHDGGRQDGRAGDPEVLRETGHGIGLL